ncbi:PKD domain-containing protein [Methanoculleus sp. FWC-SCC1]|uniref:PKD domain-containing protein n=1 Tax=Methanoculleus frigidifontis TaxID=2584085 RepID=A0ABT8M7F4_9EURY|nr:S8 family serine peptidase [Methanoculleus sp. FWC-SCC1]MDN7023863.1 PKD domain-containing protein [Methanoculleus sp. FWC-SCC1]
MKRTLLVCLITLFVICSTLITGAGAERVIIGFRDDPDQSMLHQGTIQHVHREISAVTADLPGSVVEKMGRDPRIAFIEPDYRVSALAETVPWGVSRIGAPRVHTSVNGDGVRIAVLDTGIDYTHPDLDENYRGGYDFVGHDADPMDDNGHGTHCAGIIAAEDDGSGIVGVAPGAEVYAVKVLDKSGGGYISDVVAGIEWAIENDIQIISMSLGGNSDSYAFRSACDAAYDAGVLIVAAAGNDGRYSGYGDTVDYPARYDSVIAVAATDRSDRRASWSSTGPDVELAAPGVDIYSTYPGGYKTISGTSMACPHVAGVAALLMEAQPGWGNAQVREHLAETADALGRSTWYGNGLVNAVEAVGIPDADTTPPLISDVDVAEVTGSSAVITWQTDEAADSAVHYGVSASDLSRSVSDSAPVTSHTLQVPELLKETTYYFRVTSTDASGNAATDPEGGVPYLFSTPANDPPVADAGEDRTASDADGDGVESITLDGSGSYDPDGSIAAWQWTEGEVLLGDGETLTGDYTVGTHTVILQVTDTDGASATDTVTVTVEPNRPPVADAGGNVAAAVDAAVSFDGSASYDSDGTIIDFVWDFGDGTGGAGSTVMHTYTASGTYTATLTVVDDGGASDTDTFSVTVTEVASEPEMHVERIDMGIQNFWFRIRGLAAVTIADADGNPVSGAEVSGHWSGLGRGTERGLTGADGSVTFTSNLARKTSEPFVFTVDAVAKDGWVYTPSANRETSDSISL